MRSTPSPSSGSRALRAAEQTGARNRRISSTSPASRNAPARCGPPSSRIEVTPAAPSWSSAERTRAGLVLAGGDDDLGAGDLQRVGRGARRGAGDDDGQRHLGGAAHELGVERQAGLGVEDDPARLARARPRCARSAAGRRPARCRCRPRPRRHSARQWWASARRGLAGDPLRVAGLRVATLPSSVIADLKSTHGRPGARVLAEGLVEQARAGGELAVGERDLDALVAQDPQAAAGGLLGRVVGGDDDAGDPGLRRSRRCTAACGRCGSTARARRTASRPRRSASPAAAIASRSACGAPSAACQPSPSTSPSRTMTAPTSGLGLVRPARARRARSPARGGSDPCPW